MNNSVQNKRCICINNRKRFRYYVCIHIRDVAGYGGYAPTFQLNSELVFYLKFIEEVSFVMSSGRQVEGENEPVVVQEYLGL